MAKKSFEREVINLLLVFQIITIMLSAPTMMKFAITLLIFFSLLHDHSNNL